MKIFNIEVWYRYLIGNEMEKDFDIFKIESNNLKYAMIKALKNFENSSYKPFSIYCGIIKVKPNELISYE